MSIAGLGVEARSPEGAKLASGADESGQSLGAPSLPVGMRRNCDNDFDKVAANSTHSRTESERRRKLDWKLRESSRCQERRRNPKGNWRARLEERREEKGKQVSSREKLERSQSATSDYFSSTHNSPVLTARLWQEARRATIYENPTFKLEQKPR